MGGLPAQPRVPLAPSASADSARTPVQFIRTLEAIGLRIPRLSLTALVITVVLLTGACDSTSTETVGQDRLPVDGESAEAGDAAHIVVERPVPPATPGATSSLTPTATPEQTLPKATKSGPPRMSEDDQPNVMTTDTDTSTLDAGVSGGLNLVLGQTEESDTGDLPDEGESDEGLECKTEEECLEADLRFMAEEEGITYEEAVRSLGMAERRLNAVDRHTAHPQSRRVSGR